MSRTLLSWQRMAACVLALLFSLFLLTEPKAEDKDAVIRNALDALDQTEALLQEERQGPSESGAVTSSPVPATPAPERPALELIDPEALLSERIRVEFQEEDLFLALRSIGRQSGLPIQVDAGVVGSVTLTLADVEVRDILKVLVDRHGLAMVVKDSGVRIMTAETFESEYSYRFDQNFSSRVVRLKYIDPQVILPQLEELKGSRGRITLSGDHKTVVLVDTPANLKDMTALMAKKDVEVRTEIFLLAYAPGQEVLGKVRELLTDDRGYARYDETERKVIVTDTVPALARITESVQAWDVPHRVMIETESVRVILSEEYQSGIDWEAIVSDYRCLTEDESSCTPYDKDVSVGSISQEDYDVLMEAMDTVGQMSFAPGPGVMALARDKITLGVGFANKEMTLELKDAGSRAKTGAGPQADVSQDSSLPEGMDFEFVPVVHLDQSLTLTVIPSRPLRKEKGGQAKIDLAVGDDKVAVIGGMFEEEQIQMTRKVPLLGDVPFLGRVFQRQRTKSRRIEHVVFIRARVLDY